jgi:AraC-like DNA-binding protein
MIYVEHQPGPAISGCVRRLWYCKAPSLPHARERVLPRGDMQIIVNLAGDRLTQHSIDHAGDAWPLPASIVVGPRGRYDLVDTRDLEELVGVVFWPGGAAPFFREDAGPFFEKFISLEDIVGRWDVRALLQEQPSPREKLLALERWLAAGVTEDLRRRKPAVIQALELLSRHSVRESARSLGLSERRLHQIFMTEVGLSPKLWSRVQRFQRAVDLLHKGAEPRWSTLALDCGFYDQSHFCNEFNAFSGINPSAYSSSRRVWVNHVPE